jgi:hypothetical protein
VMGRTEDVYIRRQLASTDPLPDGLAQRNEPGSRASASTRAPEDGKTAGKARGAGRPDVRQRRKSRRADGPRDGPAPGRFTDTAGPPIAARAGGRNPEETWAFPLILLV